jgi:hypothetical protein
MLSPRDPFSPGAKYWTSDGAAPGERAQEGRRSRIGDERARSQQRGGWWGKRRDRAGSRTGTDGG